MERGIFKVLPTHGTRACEPISLDGEKKGLVREEGQVLSHVNMK